MAGGNLTNWLNELAFVPVDYRADGPVDEWSGDRGCGVNYFSQQGACRLMPNVGIHLPADMKFPEQLVELQNLMAASDPRALKVYEALGIEFGYVPVPARLSLSLSSSSSPLMSLVSLRVVLCAYGPTPWGK